MSVLRYRHNIMVDDLTVGECTIHRASDSHAARWWLLWFYVLRDSDAQPEVFCVPVNPGGAYVEAGPGGRTWGLTCPPASAHMALPGTKNWMVAPSINVLDDRDAVAGSHAHPSLWQAIIRGNFSDRSQPSSRSSAKAFHIPTSPVPPPVG